MISSKWLDISLRLCRIKIQESLLKCRRMSWCSGAAWSPNPVLNIFSTVLQTRSQSVSGKKLDFSSRANLFTKHAGRCQPLKNSQPTVHAHVLYALMCHRVPTLTSSERIISGLRWIAVLSSETAGIIGGNLLDTLCAKLEKLMSFTTGERDSVMLQHRFVVEWEGERLVCPEPLHLLLFYEFRYNRLEL